jgi:hypothetical protein
VDERIRVDEHAEERLCARAHVRIAALRRERRLCACAPREIRVRGGPAVERALEEARRRRESSHIGASDDRICDAAVMR